jgi:hypothetical protein
VSEMSDAHTSRLLPAITGRAVHRARRLATPCRARPSPLFHSLWMRDSEPFASAIASGS